MMPKVDPQDRDRRILEHVGRYRLTTADVLHARFFATLDAAKAVIKRLAASRGRQLLQARPLGVGRRVYYHLTAAGVREIGVPASRAEALGPQALPEAYAILVHCCKHSRDRQIFTRAELSAHPLLRDAPPGNYYLEQIDEHRSRLTQLVIDHRTEHTRLLQKCRKILREAEEIASLVRLIDQGVFGLTVLTLHDEKKKAVEFDLERRPLPVHVSVDVIPFLSEIIEGHPDE